MLYFVFNPNIVAVVIVHNLKEGEFVAQIPFFPPLQSLSDFEKDVCVQYIRSIADIPLDDVQVCKCS